jgi:hypothetical protein
LASGKVSSRARTYWHIQSFLLRRSTGHKSASGTSCAATFDPKDGGPHLWKRRFDEINNFERYLTHNGTAVLKFFLNISRKEQKKRFLKRIEQKEKNWKFSASDIRERQSWDKYMIAYEEAFAHTSTPWAPWSVVPADHKWFTRVCVSQIIVATLKALALKYPKPTKEQLDELEKAKQELLKED